MNKKMREIQTELQQLNKEAEDYIASNDLTKAEEALDKIDAKQKEFDLLARAEEAKKKAVPAEPVVKATGDEGEGEGAKVDSTKAFANAARRGFKSLNEGADAPEKGAYTVPQDIVTQIQHRRESKTSLLSHVTKVKVSTNYGARTFKKRSQQEGFTEVGEGGKVGRGATPEFERIEYNIKKYGGWFPVTNELLADSDANIANELINWIGDESRVTANKLIIEAIKSTADGGAYNPVTGIDDIKSILNVELGSAFKSTSKIYTNDSGLQWLDTLKDVDERYLLQPNPAEPMKLQLCAGATTVPVVVIPNSDLPDDAFGGTGIPLIIGDLAEAVVYWDREQLTIKSSDVAVAGELNAYEEDLTLFRALEREDVTSRDAAAIRVCEISIV